LRLLLINAVSCRCGGGLTDLVGTLPLLNERMRQRKWRVHTCVVEPGRAALEEAGIHLANVHVVDVVNPLRRCAWEAHTLPRWIGTHQPDVVLHFSNFVPRRLRVPQVTVLRSAAYFSTAYCGQSKRGAYENLRYALGRRLTRRTFENADLLLCVSRSLRERAQYFSSRDGQLRVAHLGSPQWPECASKKADKAELAASLATPERDRIAQLVAEAKRLILNVAHDAIQKNLGDFLRALEQLQCQRSDVAGVVTAGLTSGSRAFASQRRAEKQLAKQLAARGMLVDAGPVPRQDVPSLLALADVLAFPSSVESFGHPLLEAQTMGVPVVASDTAVHREIAGTGALYYPLGDAGAMADRIDRLLNDRSLALRQTELGSANAARFTWEKHVDALVDAICDVADAAR